MKRLLSSIVVAGLLVTTSLATDTKTNNVTHNAVVKAQTKAQNKELIDGALKALKDTQQAVIALNKKDILKAKQFLKEAIGEFTLVLNSPNPPYLLPIDINVETYEYLGDILNISKQIKDAKVALAKNNLPLAREILNSLKSEIDIKAVNIPLATYPQAIKLAVKYLNENKITEAKDVMMMALNTLVTTDTIIPIPLIKANELVIQASKIAHKDKKQTLKYLSEAKQQLKISRLLGYSSKSDTTYKMLKDSIENIENKLNHNKNTDSLFDNLKAKLKDFKEKAVSIISK